MVYATVFRVCFTKTTICCKDAITIEYRERNNDFYKPVPHESEMLQYVNLTVEGLFQWKYISTVYS